MKQNRTSIGRQGQKLPLWLGLVLVLIAACSPVVPSSPAPDAQLPATPPQLLDSFAVSVQRSGQTWQIFVEGSDPDGDMKDIWVVVSQLGGNMWSNQFIALQGEDRRRFMGYLAMPTPGNWGFSGWETVRVEVHIRDYAGLHSELRTHEVVIGSAAPEPIPAKWNEAARHRLGTILLDFESDREHNRPGHRR
jgi:hypothetical protein